MTVYKQILITFLCFQWMACSSSKLKIDSLPVGAKVSAQLSDKTIIDLGKTPLQISKTALPTLSDETIMIRLENEGYSPYSIILPPSNVSYTGNLHIQLESIAGDRSALDKSLISNEIVSSAAEIYKYVYKKQYAQALTLIDSQISKYPKSSIYFDLKGNVLYLEKKYSEAA